MHPVIFQFKAFTLYTLWIFIALALIVGVYALIKISVKNNLKVQFLSDNFLKLFLYFLLGARILSILINYKTYLYEISTDVAFNLFYIWDRGLNFWGGLIALIIYFYQICKKNEQNFWKWLEVIVPATIIGLSIAHIGAFFDGISYGKPSDLPWASNFANYSIKYAVPIHPTQIYAFLYSALIATCLVLLSQTKRIKNIKSEGFIALSGIILYSFFRFLESFLRGDDIFMLGPIRVDTIISSIIFISTGTFLYLRYNRPDLFKKFKHKK